MLLSSDPAILELPAAGSETSLRCLRNGSPEGLLQMDSSLFGSTFIKFLLSLWISFFRSQRAISGQGLLDCNFHRPSKEAIWLGLMRTETQPQLESHAGNPCLATTIRTAVQSFIKAIAKRNITILQSYFSFPLLYILVKTKFKDWLQFLFHHRYNHNWLYETDTKWSTTCTSMCYTVDYLQYKVGNMMLCHCGLAEHNGKASTIFLGANVIISWLE